MEMGVDETGRGSVLGPMIYCGAFSALGYEWPSCVDDSKKLTPAKRESILARLKTLPIGFIVRSISAAEISSVMLAHNSGNLNSLSHDATKQMVNTVLQHGLMLTNLYVDTVGISSQYQDELQRAFPNIRVTVCEKADSRFKSVGAASINAKVIRDAAMRDFAFEEPNMTQDRNFGCGYPEDRTTVTWMENNFDRVFGFPSVARFSWTPVRTLFVKRDAVADWEGESETPKGVSSFFAVRGVKPACGLW